MDEKILKRLHILQLIFGLVLVINAIFYNFYKDMMNVGFYLAAVCLLIIIVFGVTNYKLFNKNNKTLYLIELILSIIALFIIYFVK